MSSEAITIHVDADAADAYRTASEEDRRKLDLLIGLQIRDIARSPESLQEVMREVSGRAQARGLTPHALESILNER